MAAPGGASAQAAVLDVFASHGAVQTRRLQTELMVAALYCDQHVRYNAFIRRFEGELIDSGRALKLLFVRLHGPSRAVPALDTYLTRIANEESQRRLREGARYCLDAAKLFTRVLALDGPTLAAFANARPVSRGALRVRLTAAPAS